MTLREVVMKWLGRRDGRHPDGAVPPEEKARREADARYWAARARGVEALAELQTRERR